MFSPAPLQTLAALVLRKLVGLNVNVLPQRDVCYRSQQGVSCLYLRAQSEIQSEIQSALVFSPGHWLYCCTMSWKPQHVRSTSPAAARVVVLIGQVVPGVGEFSRRYFEAKDVMEAEAVAAAKERELSSTHGRRWWRLQLW